jgi:hypothetical protein
MTGARERTRAATAGGWKPVTGFGVLAFMIAKLSTALFIVLLSVTSVRAQPSGACPCGTTGQNPDLDPHDRSGRPALRREAARQPRAGVTLGLSRGVALWGLGLERGATMRRSKFGRTQVAFILRQAEEWTGER